MRFLIQKNPIQKKEVKRMKKIYINSLIAFLLLNLCAPAIASEKNWFKSTMSHYTQDMLNRHTYQYKSLQHVAAGVALLCLPSPMALYILKQQRTNMVKFLHANEAATREDVRQYWNFDQQTWSNIMNKTKEDHEFNLNAMRNNTNCNTHHDPSLPPEVITGIERECNRYGFNKNNLNFGKTTEEDILGCATAYIPTIISETKIYTPAVIDLNIEELEKKIYLKDYTTNHVLAHEFRHVAEGHGIEYKNITLTIKKPLTDKEEQLKNIENERKTVFQSLMEKRNWLSDMLWDSHGAAEKFKKLNTEVNTIEKEISALEEDYTKTLKEFSDSPAGKNYIAAREKTADTRTACDDPEAAKNAYHTTSTTEYIDNHNDMKVVHANWQMTKNIENARNFYHAFEKKRREFNGALKKYMPL
jgi:hypothetical protein